MMHSDEQCRGWLKRAEQAESALAEADERTMMYVIAQRSDEESNDWRLYATASSHKDAERIWARARKDGLTVRIMTPAQLDEKTGDEATLLADDGELFVQKTFAVKAEAEVEKLKTDCESWRWKAEFATGHQVLAVGVLVAKVEQLADLARRWEEHNE